MADALTVLRASLTERLAALRGVPEHALPPALLDLTVQRVRVPGGDVFLVHPVDWEQLRHEAGGAGRPVPYWATPWPSGAGAEVLATDGSEDAVAFAAHSLALNELAGEVAQVDWAEQGDALAARGPWDLVLAADVLYLKANVDLALELMPRLVAPGGEVRLADPRRAGTRDFLAAARARFTVRTKQEGEVALHRLRPRTSGRRR
jgi:predicted nicotinamide N-methyase